jgi:hypothetical protein
MRFGRLGNILIAVLVTAGSAAAQGRGGITLFEDTGHRGRSATVDQDMPSIKRYNLDNKVSSLRVDSGEAWEACENPNFGGRCQVFSNTEPDLRRAGWNDRISSLRRVRGGGSGGGWGGGSGGGTGGGWGGGSGGGIGGGTGGGWGGGGSQTGRLELFDKRNFGGKSSALMSPSPSLGSMEGRAESLRLSGQWEICDRPNFRGQCRVVSDDVGDLRRIGWNDRIRSARPR